MNPFVVLFLPRFRRRFVLARGTKKVKKIYSSIYTVCRWRKNAFTIHLIYFCSAFPYSFLFIYFDCFFTNTFIHPFIYWLIYYYFIISLLLLVVVFVFLVFIFTSLYFLSIN